MNKLGPHMGAPTTPSGCVENGRNYAIGEQIPTIESCRHCYCGPEGVKECKVVECNLRGAHNCKPITPEGHCCPIRFECPAAGDFRDVRQCKSATGEGASCERTNIVHQHEVSNPTGSPGSVVFDDDATGANNSPRGRARVAAVAIDSSPLQPDASSSLSPSTPSPPQPTTGTPIGLDAEHNLTTLKAYHHAGGVGDAGLNFLAQFLLLTGCSEILCSTDNQICRNLRQQTNLSDSDIIQNLKSLRGSLSK